MLFNGSNEPFLCSKITSARESASVVSFLPVATVVEPTLEGLVFPRDSEVVDLRGEMSVPLYDVSVPDNCCNNKKETFQRCNVVLCRFNIQVNIQGHCSS